MRYSIATGRAKRDPVADLRGALTHSPENHYAAITEPVELAPLLRALYGYSGTLTVRMRA